MKEEGIIEVQLTGKDRNRERETERSINWKSWVRDTGTIKLRGRLRGRKEKGRQGAGNERTKIRKTDRKGDSRRLKEQMGRQ